VKEPGGLSRSSAATFSSISAVVRVPAIFQAQGGDGLIGGNVRGFRGSRGRHQPIAIAGAELNANPRFRFNGFGGNKSWLKSRAFSTRCSWRPELRSINLAGGDDDLSLQPGGTGVYWSIPVPGGCRTKPYRRDGKPGGSTCSHRYSIQREIYS
jgi:hypothetical protein